MPEVHERLIIECNGQSQGKDAGNPKEDFFHGGQQCEPFVVAVHLRAVDVELVVVGIQADEGSISSCVNGKERLNDFLQFREVDQRNGQSSLGGNR